jgi:hypothetical protein
MTIGSAAFGLACLCLHALAAIVGPGTAKAAGCSNEAFRRGPSALLPECRAYEMVSPLDKSGGSVSTFNGVRAAPDGSAVYFGSSASFAGDPGSPLFNAYVADRGSNWSTQGVDPLNFNEGSILIRSTLANSPDLRYSLGMSRVALTPDAQEGGSNLYLRDNATGALTLLVSTPGKGLAEESSPNGGGTYIAGANTDFRHVLLHSKEALPVPASGPQPVPGEENLYDVTRGEVHVVNVLPDGTVQPATEPRHPVWPDQRVLSDDGSRVFFVTGGFTRGTGPLYMREDNTTTTPISEVQFGPKAGEVAPAEYGGASADGSVVYFKSIELIEGQGIAALYRYDVTTHELSALVPNPPANGSRPGRILDVSRDGSYVYFTAQAALVEGATTFPLSSFAANFYVWHNGVIRFIGATTESEGAPTQLAVSPNGKLLAFATAERMTGEDVPSPACAGEKCLDVYAYQYEVGRLTCISCRSEINSSGKTEWLPGRGPSELGGYEPREAGESDEFARSVLSDGTVFLETPNTLLARDVNGVGDVYAWREGAYELISTGTSEQASQFGDATPDGSNVYFLTTQRLVKQDTDGATDLYDDRELGGLASQWPPGSTAPCEGEGCRGAAPTPPAGLPEGSAVTTPGKTAPRSCTTIRAKAKKASRQARRLAKRARRSAKRNGANARSRRLHRKATTARKRAHRIHQKAATCGRKG